jgi:enterochelin esterase-like enzyme
MKIKANQKLFILRFLKLKGIVFLMILLCNFSNCPAQVLAPYIKYTYDDLNVFDNGAKFYHCKYFSNVFNTEVGYLIYLPKHYFENPDSIFPVMYYMHGSGGNYVSEYKRAVVWNQGMENELPEMVMVMTNLVDENYHMVNFEKTMIEELRTHIIQTYRVSDKGECTAVSGFSLGGQASMLIALKHSQLFSQGLSFSGAPFLDLDDYISNYLNSGTGELNIRVTVGTIDRAISSSHYLKKELTSAGILFDYKEYEGIAHSSSQAFNDSAYRTETFLWQKENFLRTCPVPLRSAEIPQIAELDLPFVDEYNPVASTPLPPNGFKFIQISPSEFQFSWLQSSIPVNGYILQRCIKDEPGFVTLDTLSPETLSYTDTLDVVCDSIYYYQIYTFNDIGTSKLAIWGIRTKINCLATSSQVNNLQSFAFYPNPTHDRITIELGDNNQLPNVSILITDINGKKILKQKVVKPAIELNVSEFPKGIYIVNVFHGLKCINSVKFTVD